MKIGITGGGNPHALAFVRRLSAMQVDCFGIGRSARKAPPLWLAPDGYRYYQAHLGTEHARTMGIIDYERPDVIVNFAAQGESAASFGAHSYRYYATNCVALAMLVGALKERKFLRCFLQVSTSELYGSTETPALEFHPDRPTSPYALSKATFDAHLRIEFQAHKFPMLIARPSNCYVEGQQLHRIVPKAVIAALYGKKLHLQGGGTARKSYLHSDDLAAALVRLIEAGHPGCTYNVGPESPIRITDLVGVIAEVAGVERDSFVTNAPARFGEDSCYWIESFCMRALGWRPQISLRDGIARMVEWGKLFPELATMPDVFEMQP